MNSPPRTSRQRPGAPSKASGGAAPAHHSGKHRREVHDAASRTLNLRALEIFVAVASTGGHSQAAELLDITQPAVSMQIRHLEQSVGVQLFEGHRRQRLSHAGNELLRHARLILQQVRLARASVDTLAFRSPSEDGPLAGLLNVAVVSSAHYFTPGLMHEFQKGHPDVRLKLSLGRRDEVLDLLREQQVDLAIMGFPPSEADLDSTAFARNPHCIVAAASHPLAKRAGLRWADLCDEQFIFREPGSATRQFLAHLLQREAIQVEAGLEMAGNETVKQAVMSGMGISFLSAHVFQLELEVGRMAVLDVAEMPKWLDWCVVQRRERPLPPAAAAFRTFVLERGPLATRCRLC